MAVGKGEEPVYPHLVALQEGGALPLGLSELTLQGLDSFGKVRVSPPQPGRLLLPAAAVLEPLIVAQHLLDQGRCGRPAAFPAKAPLQSQKLLCILCLMSCAPCSRGEESYPDLALLGLLSKALNPTPHPKHQPITMSNRTLIVLQLALVQ